MSNYNGTINNWIMTIQVGCVVVFYKYLKNVYKKIKI